MAVQAQRCRRLEKYATGQTRDTLRLLAEDYEQREKTAAIEAGPKSVSRLSPVNDLSE